MNPSPSWFPRLVVPSLSVAGIVLTFSVGVYFGHATEARAQYVSLVDYQAHLVAEQIKAIKDSARMDVLFQSNVRIERMQLRLNCRLLHECDQ